MKKLTIILLFLFTPVAWAQTYSVKEPLANFKAKHKGPVTFAVLGSFKGGSGGGQIDWILKEDPTIDGFISMGDMVSYKNPNYDRWKTELAKFYNTHFHIPVRGDQERKSEDGTTFNSLYNLDPIANHNYFFTLNVDGTTYTIVVIKYKNPKLSQVMQNMDGKANKTFKKVMKDAKVNGHSIIVLGHRQWFDNCAASKYYQPASPTDPIIKMFDETKTDLVLSADNPGFCHQVNGSTDYVRVDGAKTTREQRYRSYYRMTLSKSDILLERVVTTSKSPSFRIGDIPWNLNIPLE